MIKEKISSQEIIDLVASKASVSKRAAEEFLKIMISTIEEGLLAGEVVKIKNFGTFKLQWNEPRKSVNIQTKEEILINGYFKVVFIPDTELKEQVNEPFAHLEPVELDVEAKKNELIDENEVVSDPLRIFTEQASEIKNLISEIQALSKKSSKPISEEELIQEIKLYDQENDQENEEVNVPEKVHENIIEGINTEIINQNNQVVKDSIKVEESILIEETPQVQDNSKESSDEIAENYTEVIPINSENIKTESVSDLQSTPYLENIKPTNKSKIRILILLILVLVIGSGIGLYFYYKPTKELSIEYSIDKISQKISISEIINSVSKWFTPEAKSSLKAITIVVPKDTNDYDSINENKPIDSLQILFENPRVYNNYIASERINVGSRLTILSKRYYGIKDFWVYIYEANKEIISNPDNIAIGTIIRIPKLDPRLIDTTNPRCIEKAKELHDIYIR